MVNEYQAAELALFELLSPAELDMWRRNLGRAGLRDRYWGLIADSRVDEIIEEDSARPA